MVCIIWNNFPRDFFFHKDTLQQNKNLNCLLTKDKKYILSSWDQNIESFECKKKPELNCCFTNNLFDNKNVLEKKKKFTNHIVNVT